MNPRKILVTAALPYANGDIHLGHMPEVNVAVCIGEGGSDKNLAWVHLSILKLVDCISGNCSAFR